MIRSMQVLALCAALVFATGAQARGFLGIGDGKPGVIGIGDGRPGVAGIGDNRPGALGVGDGKAGAFGVGERDNRPECCRRHMTAKQARRHQRWHDKHRNRR